MPNPPSRELCKVNATEIPTGKSGESAIVVAKETAYQVGRFLADRFQGKMDVSFKGKGNPVTDIDVEAERMAVSILQDEFPDFHTLGEESAGGRSLERGYTWVVDPIDGTRNFIAGIPFFSIVVGLVHDGQVLLGINHDPMQDEMFWAVRGQGAFLNDKPISVSEKTSLEDCFIGLDMSYNTRGALRSLKVVESIWPGMQTARIMGSSALGLSYAAAGRIDLYFHHRLSPWDIVAGLLLVREANGVVTDRHGKEATLYPDGIIASSAALHAEFMRRTEGMDWRKASSD